MYINTFPHSVHVHKHTPTQYKCTQTRTCDSTLIIRHKLDLRNMFATYDGIVFSSHPFLPSLLDAAKTSGAKCAGFPPGAIPGKHLSVKSAGSVCNANPKSQIFIMPSSDARMFSSFMSRWMTPFWRRNSSPSAICLVHSMKPSNCSRSKQLQQPVRLPTPVNCMWVC